MFKIGDFSKLSQVTVKALRLYDERGLLRPARVDRASGYRASKRAWRSWKGRAPCPTTK
jgi:DNA-binding transcriptional MerR regulator